MKTILISIRPECVEKIVNGEKTIEVRKTAPKETPFKVYIYCARAKSKWRFCDYEGAYENSNGEVVYAQRHIIGAFICHKVEKYNYDYCDGVDIDDDSLLETALAREDINIYAKGNALYGLHIKNLEIYDNPKELSEFSKVCPYYENCENCKHPGENCKKWRKIKRPPQSWMYIKGKK